jgi:hypothetical protein
MGVARHIGAVELFRSPKLSRQDPMVRRNGSDAEAVKAGLIKSIGAPGIEP